MQPRDFSLRRRFPGTETSTFDGVIRLEQAIQRIPAPLFAFLLFLLALVPTLVDWPRTVILWGFSLMDGVLLALLPRANKSFGPSKPPTLLLAMLRLLPGVFPLPWLIPAQLLGTLLVIYGFWFEPHGIHVTRQRLVAPKWLGARPLRILHLGDLHVERITARERQLVKLVQSLQADLILFSGDFLSLSNVHEPAAWEETRQILSCLKPPLGAYAVTGSPPVDVPDVVEEIVKGTGVRWLRNEKLTLEHGGNCFDLVGITCTHRPFVDAPILDSLLQDQPRRFTVLLYHSPDLAPEAARRGVDLQLSGHTHGGQVRLPFFGALYTSSLYGKRFEAGRYQLEGLTLYTSRGIGMEGMGAPRVRFLCPPEVILWEIVPGV